MAKYTTLNAALSFGKIFRFLMALRITLLSDSTLGNLSRAEHEQKYQQKTLASVADY